LDPTGWDRQYRVYEDRDGQSQDQELQGKEADGMWVWQEEEVNDEVEGRWVFKLAQGDVSAASSSSQEHEDKEMSAQEPVETVQSRQRRVQTVLHNLAKESIWPAEYLDIVPTVSGKGANAKGKVQKAGGNKKEEVLRLEEMDVGGLEDEDGLWGTVGSTGGMDGGLFDEPVGRAVKVDATGPGTGPDRGVKRTARESVDDDEDEDGAEDAAGLDDDDLFGGLPKNTKHKESSASPLFGNAALPAASSSKRQKKGQALPSDISNDFTDAESDAESSSSSSSGLFGTRSEKEAPVLQAVKGTSLKDVVKTEKKAGLAVLSALGFDLDEPRTDASSSKAKAVVLQDESSGEESDWAPAMRLRGGATDAEMESASSSSSSGSGSSPESSSEEDSSSEESSSDDSSDEEEGDVEMKTETKEVTRQQTLKDMFAPKADEGELYHLSLCCPYSSLTTSACSQLNQPASLCLPGWISSSTPIWKMRLPSLAPPQPSPLRPSSSPRL
jgi:hypothetical protein